MADANILPTTQRAYTLRLRGVNANDRGWRDALWATHEAVNKGAKVFGDWLLTLRGGLDHTLADEKVKTKGKPDRDPTQEERKNRRILLTLSWLSVEDAHGAPRDETLIVAKGTDSTDTRERTRERKLADALAAILQARGVEDTELQSWLNNCLPSLAARIRDDAVWVNRSGVFDAAQQRIGSSLTREVVWDLLERFFGSRYAYLAPIQNEEDQDEKTSAATKEKGKDLVKKAGNWLSLRFGEEEGADFIQVAEAYQRITLWASAAQAGSASVAALEDIAGALGVSPTIDAIFSTVSYTGSKRQGRFFSAFSELASQVSTDSQTLEAVGAAAKEAEARFREQGQKRTANPKGRRAYSDAVLADVESACGIAYLHPDGRARHPELSVMLDHAARRVSITHSWIKNAEAERRQFEDDAKRLDSVPPQRARLVACLLRRPSRRQRIARCLSHPQACHRRLGHDRAALVPSRLPIG